MAKKVKNFEDMTDKQMFVHLVQTEIFDHMDLYLKNYPQEHFERAYNFFEKFRKQKKKKAPVITMTSSGDTILKWMQKFEREASNIFISRSIAEGLLEEGITMSHQGIGAALRKLTNDGYVKRIGKNPAKYSLTDKGRLYVD